MGLPPHLPSHPFSILTQSTNSHVPDRNNFANARLKGLEDDLGLTDVQYQTCLSILLVGYVAMQVPSNMFLAVISRPSWYLCGCVAVWGMISAATGAVNNATQAILCRFFLGCVEASSFPGSLYFLSRWVHRSFLLTDPN